MSPGLIDTRQAVKGDQLGILANLIHTEATYLGLMEGGVRRFFHQITMILKAAINSCQSC
jgi:hypothetical protein